MVPSVRQCAACLVVAATLVAGCTRGSDATTDSTPAPTSPVTLPADIDTDGDLTIGVLLPETGDGAVLGGPIRDAITKQVDLINSEGGVIGNRVHVFFADEARARGLANLLGRKRLPVDAIVGPASSRTALRSLGQIVRSPDPVPTCSPSATALSLDDYQDGNWFFRTVPSDSLLMTAMAIRAQKTGASTVSVIYLDDPYGRGLSAAFVNAVESRGRLDVTASVALDRELTDIDRSIRSALADDPGIVVILADETVGGSILTALDEAIDPESVPQILVNDSVRTARQPIKALSVPVRQRLQAVAPTASFGRQEERTAPFAAQAVDCVNLIALAAELSGSDRPSDIRSNIQSASVGGVPCNEFAACAELIGRGRTIDYNSQAGSVDLGATGDPLSGSFDAIRFKKDGTEDQARPFEIP